MRVSLGVQRRLLDHGRGRFVRVRQGQGADRASVRGELARGPQGGGLLDGAGRLDVGRVRHEAQSRGGRGDLGLLVGQVDGAAQGPLVGRTEGRGDGRLLMGWLVLVVGEAHHGRETADRSRVRHQ